MQPFALTDHPHRRFNPLTGEWVLVSPHRTKRPWQGQVEKLAPETRPAYDPGCYLCPGNSRAGGYQNPPYEHTFVFDNDFAALMPEEVAGEVAVGELLRAVPEQGVCRVVCFSPRHDLTLGEMPISDIRRVVDTWAEQTVELGALPYISNVQVFENRGAMMGASNPHGQIQRPSGRPTSLLRGSARRRAALPTARADDYLQRTGRVSVARATTPGSVGAFRLWPFETLLLPRRNVASISELGNAERDALADILKRLITRYDNLFEVSFPYSMGWHQRPTDGRPHPGHVLHAHFYPPLLRSATVRKFMVGFEMLGEPQRDMPAEAAAAACAKSETHYRQRTG
jgi:UDPglucose--hexose-1-phosphate uridylyltransferase